MGNILGLWDGHDAGVAVFQDGRLSFALNEERLSRRKLEIRFPEAALRAALDFLKLTPADFEAIAVSTSDPAKTLARVYPQSKEEYYLIRRRLLARPETLTPLKKLFKYQFTTLPPNVLSARISASMLGHKLNALGWDRAPLLLTSHHLAHALAAAHFSGFERALVMTLDGIGDGLSGSINLLQGGRLTQLAELRGRHSFGIFFEHVTNLLHMRELEDEGKVMALANYARPVPDKDNPLLDYFAIDGLKVSCRFGPGRLYQELKKVLWRFPPEQFAYLAQRALELFVIKLTQNAIAASGARKLALAGGVAANIKVNMQLRLLPEVDEVFVFPHVGDGGLAVGAALDAATRKNGGRLNPERLPHAFWGLDYSEAEMEAAIKRHPVKYRRCPDIESRVADLIVAGKIVLWFQGRMEYGPRALGHRSILARADSLDIKQDLNLALKRRVWYQPFCPSLLEEDAPRLLADYDGHPDRFMTMGFHIRPEVREQMLGVINIDDTCRPQIVGKECSRYRRLLLKIKKRMGKGLLLNTSFNIHGEPLVCSPDDALRALLDSGATYMALGDFLVER